MPDAPEEDEQNPNPDTHDDASDPLMLAAARAFEATVPAGSVPGEQGATSDSQPSGPLLKSGTIIAGRYRLDNRLGEGGMGEVWAATHLITRRRVAMKFLKGPASMRTDMRQRLLREARAASVVKHPSVVEILDVFELEGGVPVLVMDLLVGETLAARLEKSKVLPVGQTAALLLPVVEAVEAAHAKGIVHRDLKPENIFLSQGEARDVRVKVLDFGIAKLTAKEGDAADTGALTGTGSVVGTPWYMSPEQCYGERDIDPRADVWALGVILYECLAGVRPVEGSSMGQVLKRLLHDGVVPIEQRVSGVPSELAALIRRMLSHGREGRPRDLSETRRVLSKLAGRPAQPARDSAQSAGPIEPSTAADSIASGEATPQTARPDTDASHSMPGPAIVRSRGGWKRSLIALGIVAIATVGLSIVYSAGRDHRVTTADRPAPPRDNASGFAKTASAASLVPTPEEIPSPARGAPAANVAGTPRMDSSRASPASRAQGGPIGPARAERATESRARSAVDAGAAVTTSSAVAPENAQPPKPKTPEGRLLEDVPF
jgi:serine/threonine-protein kinase